MLQRVHEATSEAMKDSSKLSVDSLQFRRRAESQQLKPSCSEIVMSELRLRPFKEETRNGTGPKIGHYKTTNREPAAFEGGHAKCKETEAQDGGVNPPLQRPIRCSLHP